MLIVGLYLLSSCLVPFVEVEEWYPYFDPNSYTVANFLLYTVTITIALIPAVNLGPRTSNLSGHWGQHSNSIAAIMIVGGIFSLVYQLPYAMEAREVHPEILRVSMESSGAFVLPKSWLTTFAVGISAFYIFYMALFFASLLNKAPIWISCGLLVSSFSYVISGMTFQTRDVYIFYSLSFVFMYLYFRPSMGHVLRSRISTLLTLIGLVGAYYVITISSQRFSEGGDSSFAYGTIGYLAQQPFVFSEAIEKHQVFYGGALRFPVLYSILTGVESPEIVRLVHYEWSFGTFAKDLFCEGGMSFMVISVLGFSALFFLLLSRLPAEDMWGRLIVSIYYFQFMSEGIFYIKLGDRAGNIYSLVLAAIFLSRRHWAGLFNNSGQRIMH